MLLMLFMRADGTEADFEASSASSCLRIPTAMIRWAICVLQQSLTLIGVQSAHGLCSTEKGLKTAWHVGCRVLECHTGSLSDAFRQANWKQRTSSGCGIWRVVWRIILM